MKISIYWGDREFFRRRFLKYYVILLFFNLIKISSFDMLLFLNCLRVVVN